MEPYFPAGKDSPGSQAPKMMSWNAARTHLTIGRNDRTMFKYKVADIAKEFGIEQSSLCWGWAFSFKSGEAALAMCDSYGSPGHDGLAGPCHRLPAKWDLDVIKRKFRQYIAPANPPPTEKRFGDRGRPSRSRSPGRAGEMKGAVKGAKVLGNERPVR